MKGRACGLFPAALMMPPQLAHSARPVCNRSACAWTMSTAASPPSGSGREVCERHALAVAEPVGVGQPACSTSRSRGRSLAARCVHAQHALCPATDERRRTRPAPVNRITDDLRAVPGQVTRHLPADVLATHGRHRRHACSALPTPPRRSVVLARDPRCRKPCANACARWSSNAAMPSACASWTWGTRRSDGRRQLRSSGGSRAGRRQFSPCSPAVSFGTATFFSRRTSAGRRARTAAAPRRGSAARGSGARRR